MGKYDYYSHNVTKSKQRYLDTRNKAPRVLVVLLVVLVVLVLIVALDRVGLVRIPFVTNLLDGIVGSVRRVFDSAASAQG